MQKRVSEVILIGMPCWGVEHPFHSLAWVGAIMQSADWKCTIVDANIKIYNMVSDEDKKYWGEEVNLWTTDLLPAKLYKQYRDPIEELLHSILSTGSYDIIAFSVNKWTRYFSIKAAEYCNNFNPDIPILFGGIDCFPREIGTGLFSINQKVPDIILQGEAEESLPLFLKEYKQTQCYYTSIPGFAYRMKGKDSQKIIVNGALIVPNLFNMKMTADYSQFEFDEYPQKGSFPTFLSRGCINRCNFCSESPNFSKFRNRNPEIVIKEILSGVQIVSKISSFPMVKFSDSLINGNIKVLSEFIDLLITNDIKIRWAGQMYFREELTFEFLKKMYNSGFRGAFWGLESGSQEIINLMNKNYQIKTAIRIIEDSHLIGIKNFLPVMVGYPGESAKNFLESLIFINSFREKATFLGPGTCLARINSKLHTNWKEFGLDNNNPIDWRTHDKKNTFNVRLLRRLIASKVIQNERMRTFSENEKATLSSLNFDSPSIIHEVISLCSALSAISKDDTHYTQFIEQFFLPIKSILSNYMFHPDETWENILKSSWKYETVNQIENKIHIISYLLDKVYDCPIIDTRENTNSHMTA